MNECANRVLSLGIGVCLAETDDACSECGGAEAPSDCSARPSQHSHPQSAPLFPDARRLFVGKSLVYFSTFLSNYLQVLVTVSYRVMVR